MKLDHVGDLLIAAPALGMLRCSFPDAHITLLCGSWNVGLAQRLEIADSVLALDFFSQESADDLDGRRAYQQRETAAARLRSFGLPRFDLAIDLRRDEDTRSLLALINAQIRAGFGDQTTFGFLDIALPHAKHGPAAGMSRLHLTPSDFNRAGNQMVSAYGLHLVARQLSVSIEVETDAVWPPSDDGEADTRPLGVALWRIDLATGSDDAVLELARNAMRFGSGWCDWEPWGRWSSVKTAKATLEFVGTDDMIDLAVTLQGHTSPRHPRAMVSLSAGVSTATHVFAAGDEPVTLSIRTRARTQPAIARSDPYLMRGGRYAGRLVVDVLDPAGWRGLTLVIRTSRWKQVIARLDLPDVMAVVGVHAFSFEVELADSSDPIFIEIEAGHLDVDQSVAIVAVELDWQQGKLRALPIVHMEQQLLDLIAMIALRHGANDIAKATGLAKKLIKRRAGSTAAAATRALDQRRGRGRVFGLWRSTSRRKLIGIGLGANKETKLWSEDHFEDLCRRMLARSTIDLVFVGGPREADSVRRMLLRLDAGERALDLVATSAIDDLGELLTRMDAFIGLDTGTTHFAGRVGLPTLAIFGASHDPVEWGPVGRRSNWVAADVTCSGCSLSRAVQCGASLSCMTNLAPDTVWAAVEALLVTIAA